MKWYNIVGTLSSMAIMQKMTYKCCPTNYWEHITIPVKYPFVNNITWEVM